MYRVSQKTWEFSNIIMSARVYFIERVKDGKSQNINKQNVNIADETLIQITAFSVGITILNQRII